MRKMLLLALIVVAFSAMPALAFHDGGVAHCNGCHTMHNSEQGTPVDADGPNSWLLRDDTPSETCLDCHYGGGGGYHVFSNDILAPTAERGAGDFVFLLATNLNDNAHAAPIGGDFAGHNIVAPSYGVDVDAVPGTTGPGGLFPKAYLGCSSCHNPHGNGNFRLLNSDHDVQDGLFTFDEPAPIAESLHVFQGGVEGNDNHTAYQDGMSEWCGNCHGDFHGQDSETDMLHPSGSGLGGTFAAIYNTYNGTGQPPGSQATAYLAAVPFEDPANTTSSTAGPSATSEVSCITCHRAHATSAPHAGRWDWNVTFLDEDGDHTGIYAIPNPYEATAGALQRSLCNKCHAKD